jgi:small subunit ribosomal protein S16
MPGRATGGGRSDYAPACGVWHNVTATTRAAGPSLTRGAGVTPKRCRRSPPGQGAAHIEYWEKTTPVAVKIKLKRMGKIHAPYYRVVVADARSKRDGRAIEEIGKYHPKLEPSLIEIDSERAQYWLSVGAQPTDPVRSLLKITGDWQRFHGEAGAEGTLKTGAPGPDKREAFAAALKETHGEAEGAATTQKGRARKAEAKTDKPEARSAKPDKPDKTVGAGAGDARAEAGRAEAGKGKARKAEGAGEEATAKKTSAGSDKLGKPDSAADQADTAKAGEPDQADGGNAAGGAARKRAGGGKADATAGAAAAADEAGNGA